MEAQVPEEVKAERSRLLREEAVAGVARLLARHAGSVATVAWESEHDGVWRGLTDTNIRVYGERERGAGAGLDRVRLGGAFRDGLWAEPLALEMVLTPVTR
jgi:tRNA A37 methylthiotransferase MiaB